MGLDMYFNKVKVEQIGYFRNLNFLFFWIDRSLEGVENCETIFFDREHFEQLLDDCNYVLKAREAFDDEQFYRVAESIFPVDDFFFGSTEYNKDYVDGVVEVRDFCRNVLKDFDDEYRYEFHAWW